MITLLNIFRNFLYGAVLDRPKGSVGSSSDKKNPKTSAPGMYRIELNLMMTCHSDYNEDFNIIYANMPLMGHQVVKNYDLSLAQISLHLMIFRSSKHVSFATDLC